MEPNHWALFCKLCGQFHDFMRGSELGEFAAYHDKTRHPDKAELKPDLSEARTIATPDAETMKKQGYDIQKKKGATK